MIDPIWTAKQIFGALLIYTSIFDALKYVVQANKIRQQHSAKGMSRCFINWALSNDIVKFISIIFPPKQLLLFTQSLEMW